MVGRVRTNERCPVCHEKFASVLHPLTKDVIELVCHAHLTRPERFYIDGRGFPETGKIYKDTRGRIFDSFLVTYRQLEEMRRQVDNHEYDPSQWSPARLKEYRFDTEIERWVKTLERKSDSYNHTVSGFVRNHFVPFFGSMDVRDVRTKRIDEFYELLQGKKLAWNTVDVMMAALNTFFRRLEYLEVITKTPKFPKVEVPETPKGWINRQKQLQILAAVPEHHKLIVELLIDTAMRPGEVCGLKKRDLVDEGEIVIERSINLRGKIVAPKTKRVRYCAVTSPDLWARLLDHSRLMFPEDFLFSTKLGARYTTHRLHKIWKKACEAVGFYIPLYRGTRHSRASQKRLELEKENVRILREALGHENTGMYQRYARDRKEEI